MRRRHPRGHGTTGTRMVLKADYITAQVKHVKITLMNDSYLGNKDQLLREEDYTQLYKNDNYCLN